MVLMGEGGAGREGSNGVRMVSGEGDNGRRW